MKTTVYFAVVGFSDMMEMLMFSQGEDIIVA